MTAYNSIDNENADFVCDGTDDHVQIQQAIDNLPSGGGSVYLREGTYNIGGTITLDNNVALIGSGAGTLLYLANNVNSNVLQATNCGNLLVTNLRIWGNSLNNPLGDSLGILLENVENSKVVDCWVKDFDDYGICLYSSNGNAVGGNTCQGNGTGGIYLDVSFNNSISGNTCQGNEIDGIFLKSDNNTVSGNTCTGNG